MPGKDLKLPSVKPTLVDMYETQTRKVYNDWVHVPKSMYNKFLVVQEELMTYGVELSVYTKTVLTFMEGWVTTMSLNSVPPHTFISDFCMKKFVRIYSKGTIELDEVDVSLLNDELTLLRYFIYTHIKDHKLTVEQAINNISSMLSREYIELYSKDPKFSIEALMIMADEYNSKVVSLEGIMESASGR